MQIAQRCATSGCRRLTLHGLCDLHRDRTPTQQEAASAASAVLAPLAGPGSRSARLRACGGLDGHADGAGGLNVWKVAKREPLRPSARKVVN